MISIITPSFNQGQYIERTIQSVLSQSVATEYVVIDGGSQDQTVSILRRYADRLHFISEPDRGQAHAVNKGLQLAKGEIIGWLNSDDVYFPQALETIVEEFAKHPDVDVIYGQANHIDEHDQLIARYPTIPWNQKKLQQTCFLSQPAVFFRRQVLEKAGLLDEALHYCMDYEFWLRLASLGVKFKYVEKILAGSRFYPQTKTLSAPEKATLETVTMLQKKFSSVPSRWLITLAIVNIKSTTSFRMPQLRYIFNVLTLSMMTAFRWNGFWKGMQFCLGLPVLFACYVISVS